jgi:DNA polymerase-3 subunit delta
MAAVKAHEAARTLSRLNPAWRIILLYGPDRGLVAERALAISRQAVDDPDDPFQLIRLDGDFLAGDPPRLADEANTLGLFGARRALRVSASARSLLPAVEPLLQVPPQDALVVIEAGDLQRQNPLRVACERASCALAVPCFSDSDRDLGMIIDDMVAAAGKTIDGETRNVLAASLGNDRMVSRQELDKLLTYIGDNLSVTIEDIAAIVGENSGQDIDALVDATFAGEIDKLDAILAKVTLRGTDGNAILGGLLRHGLALPKARIAMEAGRSSKDAVGLLRGLPFPRMASAERAVRIWSLPRLRQAIILLGQASATLRRDSELTRPTVARTLWTLARLARSHSAR